jgi:hypothetical protein
MNRFIKQALVPSLGGLAIARILRDVRHLLAPARNLSKITVLKVGQTVIRAQ